MVRPDIDQKMSPGRRIRVERIERNELTTIADESTFPERVDRVDAHHINEHDALILTSEQVEWLHAVLTELIEKTTSRRYFVVLGGAGGVGPAGGVVGPSGGAGGAK